MLKEIQFALFPSKQFDARLNAMQEFEDAYKEKTEVKSTENFFHINKSKNDLMRQLILLFRQVQVLKEDQKPGIDKLISKDNELITNAVRIVGTNKTRKNMKHLKIHFQ